MMFSSPLFFLSLLGAGITLALLVILTFSLMAIDNKIDSDV
jgi:hypothetical protein